MRIIDAAEEYLDDLQNLFEQLFGLNYLSREEYRVCMRSPAPFKLAVQDNRLMGAVLFIQADKQEIEEHTKMSSQQIEQLIGDRQGVICKSACIHKDFQRQGIGQSLLDACMKEILAQKYGAVFTVLWKYGNRVPAEKLFIEFGFQREKELEMPWYDESEYICCICGGRCRCSGIVYHKKL